MKLSFRPFYILARSDVPAGQPGNFFFSILSGFLPARSPCPPSRTDAVIFERPSKSQWFSSLGFAVLLCIPSLRAAEAYFLIDAGFVSVIDTNTGDLIGSSFQSPIPSEGFGAIGFSSRDKLYIQTGNAFSGDRAFIFTSTGGNTWTQGASIQLPDATGVIRRGRGLSLQHTGLLLAIGQNSHDLWELQRINYNPNVPGSETIGKLRSFLPLQFPHHLAASPLEASYAVWFFNGTLLINNNGSDQFTTPGFSGVGGLCYDYTGYPFTDPGTQVTTTHSLLYVSNGTGNTIRRYDAVTFQPYGKPGDLSNPVLVSAGTGSMTAIDRIAVDAETGTLYAMGRNLNYAGGTDFVIAGFSTVDGTPRGLGGSATDPVVYNFPATNIIHGFAIRPGVQVQQYNGGNHTLGGITFNDPGKLLSVVNTGTGAATVQLPTTLGNL